MASNDDVQAAGAAVAEIERQTGEGLELFQRIQAVDAVAAKIKRQTHEGLEVLLRARHLSAAGPSSGGWRRDV